MGTGNRMDLQTTKPCQDAVLEEYAPVDYQPFVAFRELAVNDLRFAVSSYLSAYIHVPFCVSRCHYCSYFTNTQSREWRSHQRRYVSALEGELGFFGGYLARFATSRPIALRALHIGGGTPSVLSVEDLDSILRTVERHFDLGQLDELLFEAFPTTITREQIAILKTLATSTKVSIGVQSFHDDQLASVGRNHTGEAASRALKWVRDMGADSVSADLIVGLPGSSVNSVTSDLRMALEAGIDHLAIYPLWVFPGSPLHRAVREGTVTLPSQEMRLRQFGAVEELLADSEFERYSLFHYGRDGSRHRYTTSQMEDGDWIGFGPSATSSIGHAVFRNATDLDVYASDVAVKGNSVRLGCHLTRRERMARSVMFGLRLTQYDTARFEEEYGVPLDEVYGEQLRTLCERGLVARTDRALFVPPEGILRLHWIEQALHPHPAEAERHEESDD